jgi:thiol-disulfide isomerase/thioredoxin
MRTTIRIVAVLVAVQVMVLVIYLGIERRGDRGLMSVERLSRPSPDLVLQSAEGSVSRVSDLRGSLVLLHFWATWCPPCRDELPSLLGYRSSEPVQVLAVSVDPDWDAVWSFVAPEYHERVYLASADAVSDAFAVDELPQTFVIDRSGTLRLHFDGPQDWSSGELRDMIAALDDE